WIDAETVQLVERHRVLARLGTNDKERRDVGGGDFAELHGRPWYARCASIVGSALRNGGTMNAHANRELELGPRSKSHLLDVIVRAALILGLAALCYRVFAPFLTLMVWAMIMAVCLYPLHQAIARRIGARQGLASTAVVILGFALLVT